MNQVADGVTFPAWLQRILSLSLTILAAILYVAVLGGAVVRVAIEVAPVFSSGLERASGLLSGLVGAVVAAGFAHSKRPSSVIVHLQHPLGGRTPTAWSTLAPPSLLKAKMTSLARTLGLLPLRAPIPRNTPDESEPSTPQAPEVPEPAPAALWVAALYFGVYFLVGLGALIVTLVKPSVPEFIENAAWVWLGTVISSAYTFFGIDSQG